VELGAPEVVLVRYGELALKGKNRGSFEQALVRNMKRACEPIADVAIERSRGRIEVRPARRVTEVARRLQQVFGISSISPALGAAPAPDAILAAAERALTDALAPLPPGEQVTFRVETSRGDKTFPMTSPELDRWLAERLLPGREDVLKVKLVDPELTLGVDVRAGRAFVFAQRLEGPGGLPVSTLGRVVCLLSGGIDSPVAAWMAMKRGCSVSFVSFHSYPFLGESSKRKIERLVRVLARWQPRNRLFVVPFTEVQTAVRDSAPEPYRTVLYRRFMQRIASRVARRDKAGALVTGESLGQVASQTLENLTCIGAASELPVLRPLLCFDKQETVEVAQRIGTFDVSILPEPDCCTVFMPRKPVIRGKLFECEDAESRMDIEGLVQRALDGVDVVDVEAEL
jgi:thiamine biosynthesis protein ThiI